MESLLIAVAALACPVGMGLMMWLMMRGQRHDHAGQDGHVTQGARDGQAVTQLQQLRAEIEQLKAERRTDHRDGRPADVP
ncbi:hypothetical protein GCM10009740_16260 [Terrabacter terrae]|uniref:DUF2933 domain-containing protein n=1 Tax=Terrabacter terrae TaxID=318434 RepID=A0ABP5FLR4_9MICO